MRTKKRLRTALSSCLFVISTSLIHATAPGADLTVQAKVNFSGLPAKSEHHANDGVVLWLTPVDAARTPLPPPSKSRLQLAQKNKEFAPHLMAVEVGSVVEFPNLDPFFHNVFSLFNGKRFDLGLYESGSTKRVHFDRVGVSYIFCNIHPEMSAVIISVPTPYFAVSSATGNLAIHDITPGEYILHIWAIGNSDTNLAAGRRISIPQAGLDLGAISIDESASIAHKNKFGEDYEEKRTPAY